MIQNKLKEAYPTPLQLRNATKELQNNMEFEKEILINLVFDLENDYTSPDKSIVYTRNNLTITFNLDILCKKNQLNYLNIFSNQSGLQENIKYQFYSKDYSYNFIASVIFERNLNYNLFKVEITQKDGLSIYLPNYISTPNDISADEGLFEMTYDDVYNIYIENKCIGKATGYLKDGLCYLNRLTIEKYHSVV